MTFSRLLRPAQKLLTGSIVAAVSAACLMSTPASPAAAPHGHGGVSVATKEWKGATPQTKEWRTASTKEWKGATPQTKEWRTASTKEWRGATPQTKEWRSAAIVLASATTAPRTSAQVARSYERHVVAVINAVRHRHHLGALRFASCTQGVATRWSARLASTDTFAHQSMQRLLARCHARYVGETLGRGAISPGTLVSMWMASPPHHHILMSASPRRIGVGATRNARGEWVVAANFMRF